MVNNSKDLSERDLIYSRLIEQNKFKYDADAERAKALRKCFYKALFDISVWAVLMALIALIIIAISNNASL